MRTTFLFLTTLALLAPCQAAEKKALKGDTNGDGTYSTAEMKAMLQQRACMQKKVYRQGVEGAKPERKLDADGDNKLFVSEAKAGVTRKKWNGNDDGNSITDARIDKIKGEKTKIKAEKKAAANGGQEDPDDAEDTAEDRKVTKHADKDYSDAAMQARLAKLQKKKAALQAKSTELSGAGTNGNTNGSGDNQNYTTTP